MFVSQGREWGVNLRALSPSGPQSAVRIHLDANF
jgi:hypothetical protein